MPRPKKPAAALPFFLAEVGSKTKTTVAMSGPTEARMREYLTWASKVAGEDYQDLELKFLDRVISDAIRRDPAFKMAMKEKSDQ